MPAESYELPPPGGVGCAVHRCRLFRPELESSCPCCGDAPKAICYLMHHCVMAVGCPRCGYVFNESPGMTHYLSRDAVEDWRTFARFRAWPVTICFCGETMVEAVVWLPIDVGFGQRSGIIHPDRVWFDGCAWTLSALGGYFPSYRRVGA